MVRVPNRPAYTGMALAEGDTTGTSTTPAKTGVPSLSGTPATPVSTPLPVEENPGPAQSAPLPNADAPASQGLSVPQNQQADTAPGLTDLEFAELKLIFETLQKTSVTRGADAKQIYKEVAKAVWQKFASKINAQQRSEFNRIPKIG